MSGIDGRVAIVTRAGQGIGRADARAGIIPIIVDMDRDSVRSVRIGIEKETELECLVFEADITNPDQIDILMRQIIERLIAQPRLCPS